MVMQSVQNPALATAQFNMLQKQLREQFMLSVPILIAMENIPRHEFVPEHYKNLAYAEFQIPLTHNEFMMTPNEEARMLDALNILPSDKILEIGTGSAYVTALLATLGHSVTSLDICEDFINAAIKKLKNYKLYNVKLIQQNGAMGYEAAKPYDVICITGGLHRLNSSLFTQVRKGGRIFAILGEPPAMTATLFQQDREGNWQQQPLFETQIGYLKNIPAPSAFHF